MIIVQRMKNVPVSALRYLVSVMGRGCGKDLTYSQRVGMALIMFFGLGKKATFLGPGVAFRHFRLPHDELEMGRVYLLFEVSVFVWYIQQ